MSEEKKEEGLCIPPAPIETEAEDCTSLGSMEWFDPPVRLRSDVILERLTDALQAEIERDNRRMRYTSIVFYGTHLIAVMVLIFVVLRELGWL